MKGLFMGETADISIDKLDSEEDARLALESGCFALITYYCFQSFWFDRDNCELHFDDGSIIRRGIHGEFRDRFGVIPIVVTDIFYGGLFQFIVFECCVCEDQMPVNS
jgi:hypothetical protein